mgnify:CR=1 FL=1
MNKMNKFDECIWTAKTFSVRAAREAGDICEDSYDRGRRMNPIDGVPLLPIGVAAFGYGFNEFSKKGFKVTDKVKGLAGMAIGGNLMLLGSGALDSLVKLG